MKSNLQKISYRQIISLLGIFALSFGLLNCQSQPTQAAISQTNKSQTTRCDEHNRINCSLCLPDGTNAQLHYELVPHVVLPETIQYNHASPKDGVNVVGGGTASPFVATYVAFPSYNLPTNTEMKQINQLIYPVTPQMLPLQLPQKNSNKDNNKNNNSTKNTIKHNEKRSVETQFELDKNKQQSTPLESETEPDIKKSGRNYDSSIANEMFDRSMAILQASAMEEVVPAAPRFALDDNVTQTGIFCNSTPKSPVAWSFSSPIFKVSAVPTGFGNSNGYISQFNHHGGVNIGFQPSPVGVGQPQPQSQVGSYPFAYPPQMPPYAHNNDPNVQMLPNGMLLLSTPANHHNCGLLRCRFDHSRRYILLPPNPNQFPTGIIPQQSPQQQLPIPPVAPTSPTINPQTQAFMYPNSYLQQPQLTPVTAMTPYGMTIVGYRQTPPLTPDYGTFGNGIGNFNGNIMNVAYGAGQQFSPAQFQFIQQQQQLAQQQFIQYQLAQQKLFQQQLAQQKLSQQQFSVAQNNVNSQSSDSSDASDKNASDDSSELKTPMPINGIANNAATNDTNAIQDSAAGLYANPYAMYALQSGNSMTGVNNANVGGDASVGISGEQSVGLSTAQLNPQFSVISNPYANYPNSASAQFYGAYGMPYGFNPYAAPIYPAAQFGGTGNQFIPPYGQPYLPANYLPVGLQSNVPQQQANNQGNGLTMSDILLLMVLMKENNKPQRRLTFFERIAERRALRRQRAEQNDPFNQIMQLWSTPFYPESTARMPASNAYPYGYFGAQPSPINTANYGGYHNLYYGNSTYY